MPRSDVQENVESTPIAGSISSSTFIPSLFSTAQDEVLAQFFSQNQYVTEEMAQRVGITRPTAYLQRTFPNSVRLESIWVSEEVCDTLAEAVDEALAQYGEGEMMMMMMMMGRCKLGTGLDFS